MHTKTLWVCDFFSKKVWTVGGLVEYFVLFFIQPGTRQVHIAGITANPDGAWMAQQARNMCMFFADQRCDQPLDGPPLLTVGQGQFLPAHLNSLRAFR